MSTLLEGIFASLRGQNYSNFASFYREETQANFTYRFLKRDKAEGYQQTRQKALAESGDTLALETFFSDQLMELCARPDFT